MNARRVVVSLLLLCFASAIPAQATADSDAAARTAALATSEKLASETKFVDAFFALAPLLQSPTKGKEQEEALWKANALCGVISASQVLESYRQEPKAGELSKLEKEALVAKLNAAGAGFYYEHYDGYITDKSFLRRLVQEYPESQHRPAAEFYLLPSAQDDRKLVEEWVVALKAYIKKYDGQHVPEVALAELRIARIYDNLWSFVLEPEWSSGDPVKDAADSERYKKEALTYFTRYLMRWESLDEGRGNKPREVIRRLNEIPDGKASNVILIASC